MIREQSWSKRWIFLKSPDGVSEKRKFFAEGIVFLNSSNHDWQGLSRMHTIAAHLQVAGVLSQTNAM